MNKPKTVKEICDTYGMSHRQLGILMCYYREHIQRVNTGKRKMTAHFALLLARIAKGLASGDIKIPK